MSWAIRVTGSPQQHNMFGVASPAPQILFSYIAGAKQNIRVGSGGIMPPNLARLMVAKQFGTMASLYPGRIDLGLGRAPGTDQVTAMASRGGNILVPNVLPGDLHRSWCEELLFELRLA